MRQKPTINSRDDLIQMVVERPAWMYFHMRMGLAEEINDNGKDMLDGIKEAAKALIYLAACVGLALVHLVRIVTYPISKAIHIWIVRRDMMAEYRQICRRSMR